MIGKLRHGKHADRGGLASNNMLIGIIVRVLAIWSAAVTPSVAWLAS